MRTTPQPAAPHDPEAGYMLLAVVVMAALILVALSVAAPVVARDLRRDKEVESEHRANEYVRAIRLFYKKTNAYPGSMEALEKTNNVRFLRQKYVDPLTGKADWRVIHQPKTTIKAFFGQELAGLAAASLGSAAGIASPGGNGAGVGATSTTSTIGQTSALASGFSGASTTTTTPGTPGTTPAPGDSSSTGMFGDSAGGVIEGVGTSRSGHSILTPNQQETYETWEFWYDPRIEQLYAKSNILGGGGIGSQSASSFGQNGVTGQSNGITGQTNAAPGSGTVPAGGASSSSGTTTTLP